MDDFKSLLADGISDSCVLSDTCEIEDVLLVVQEINNKIDFYKKLKEHRVKSIDNDVSGLLQKSTTLRQVILNTMTKMAPKNKSLTFPSIGKISRRKGSETYQVEDQDQVMSFLDSQGIKNQVVKIEEKIDKRKLKVVIDRLKTTGETVPGVKKVVGNESLSITFDKTTSNDSTPTRGIDLDDLDSLKL